MKNLLIKATLVVLLSVNVLTPISYATGDLFENDSTTSSWMWNTQDSSLGAQNNNNDEQVPQNDNNMSSWAEGEGSNKESSAMHQNDGQPSKNDNNDEQPSKNDDTMPSWAVAKDLEWDAQDSSALPQNDEQNSQNDNNDGQPSQNDEWENDDKLPENPQSWEGAEDTPKNPQSWEGGEDSLKDPHSWEGDEDLLQEKVMSLEMTLNIDPLDADPLSLMATPPSQANSTTVKDLHLYFVNGSETKHYTIMDRNMWASGVNQWWYYYQWWNNWWFDHPLTDTTWNSIPYEVWGPYENKPSTYSSEVFVKLKNWQAGDNNYKFNSNLWWWSGDKTCAGTTLSEGCSTLFEGNPNGIWDTNDRQWPCSTWYYVPSAYDFSSLLYAWTKSSPTYDDSNHNASYDEFAGDLLLTLDWYMQWSDWNIIENWKGHYWTSSPNYGPKHNDSSSRYTAKSDSNLSRRLILAGGQFQIGNLNRGHWMHVRCFKDDFKSEWTTWPLTIHLNGGEKTVIAVDTDGLIHTLNTPSYPNDEKEFKWWYTTENFLDTTKVEKGDNLNWATDLYARWDGQEESFVVKIESRDTNLGTVSTWIITVPYGTSITTEWNVVTVWTETSTATESIDTDQYDFSFVDWTNNCGTTVTMWCTITANFKSEVKNYTVTVVSNNTLSGTVSTWIITVPYGTSITTEWNVVTVWTETSTATESADTDQYDFSFVDWTNNCGATVTTWCTITANFKSEVKKYTITFVDEDGTTILKEPKEYEYGTPYGDIDEPDDPVKPNIPSHTYTFDWWDPEIADVTKSVTYKAKYIETTNKFVVRRLDGNGHTLHSQALEYGETPVYPGHPLPEKHHTIQYSYQFNWQWSPIIQPVTWDISYIAQFDEILNKYLITFVDGDGNIVQNWMVEYGTTPVYAWATPTKTSNNWYIYEFEWRAPAIVDVVWNATYTANFKEIKFSNWWHWSILKKDKCPNGDYSDSYYDGECGNSDDGDAWDEDGYTDEELSAYEWAYKYGITTIDNIQDADPDGYVIRWHMAKMVVNFMINVLGFEMPETIPQECLALNNWKQSRESEEIRNYTVQSCALWVMWIDMRENNFLANDILSRAEFGTIVSRILWWNTYNVKHTKQTPYYIKHLNELNKNWIMTQIDRPLTRKELRKRVWVMLKRVAEKE